MARIAVYIDGFNLYHAIAALNDPSLKWLNLHTLARSFVEKGDSLVKVAYFSAHVSWDKGKRRRHVSYVKALQAYGVETNIAGFEKINKYCKRTDRNCPFHEEKQTDVWFAVKALNDAVNHVYDKVVLITADSDQIPTVDAIKSLNPAPHITIAAPPDRKSNARNLIGRANSHLEISAGRLRTCRLPRTVITPDGQPNITCPSSYLP